MPEPHYIIWHMVEEDSSGKLPQPRTLVTRFVSESARFTAWMRRLDEEMKSGDSHTSLVLPHRYGYINAVAIAVTEALQTDWETVSEQSLREVLTICDRDHPGDEPILGDEVIPVGCSTSSGMWVDRYPTSEPARIIRDQGLNAPLRAHMALIGEMFVVDQIEHPNPSERGNFPSAPPFEVEEYHGFSLGLIGREFIDWMAGSHSQRRAEIIRTFTQNPTLFAHLLTLDAKE